MNAALGRNIHLCRENNTTPPSILLPWCKWLPVSYLKWLNSRRWDRAQAKILFPWIMEKIVAVRIREAFTLTIILFCFFISVGMLLDLGFVAANLWKVIFLGVFILVIKGTVLFLVTGIVRQNMRLAILVGCGLAQIGEFSFVLAQAGLRFGLISQTNYQLFLASSVISMMLTPLFINAAPRLVLGVQTLLAWWLPMGKQAIESHITLEGHTLIIGFGLNGRNLAKVLRETGIPYQIVDLN